MPALQARSPVTRRLIAQSCSLGAALAAERIRSRTLIRDLCEMGRRLPFLAVLRLAGGSDEHDFDAQQQDGVRLTATVLSKLAAGV